MIRAAGQGGTSTNKISGTVEGNVVQVQQIHGNVYLREPSDAPRAPRQLPRSPRHFTGRERELAELRALLGKAEVIVLRGPEGIGRSALAAFWLHEVAGRFPAGALHADLAHPTSGPAPVEDVLGGFLRALGVPAADVPATLSERVGLYRSVTAAEPIAVLLDDAVSAAQARVLVPAAPGSLVVITTRQPLLGLVAAGAEVVQVGPLVQDEALALLRGHLGSAAVEAEWAEAGVLVGLCAGLPIALCVAAAMIRARPRRSLGWMVERLRDERRRLDVLSGVEDYSVRAAFDLVYEDLSDGARSVYLAAGLHPGALLCPDLVTAVAGLPFDEVEEALDDLVEACLAEEVEPGWFRLHALAHVHAASLPTDGDDRSRQVEALVDWYRRGVRRAGDLVLPVRRAAPPRPRPPEGAEPDDPLRWLDRVRGDLASVMRMAAAQGLHGEVVDIGDALKGFFVLRKHYAEAVEIYELTLAAAEVLGDLTAEVGMRKRLARAFSRLGRPVEAERQVRVMVELARVNDDQRAAAKAHKSLGFLYRDQGRFAEAVHEFGMSLALVRDQGRPRGEALLLLELGVALAAADRPDEALERLAAARTALTALTPPDGYNAARTDLAEGRIRLRRGETGRAGVLLHSALETMAALGAESETAAVHLELSQWAERAADSRAAREHLELGEEILRGMA